MSHCIYIQIIYICIKYLYLNTGEHSPGWWKQVAGRRGELLSTCLRAPAHSHPEKVLLFGFCLIMHCHAKGEEINLGNFGHNRVSISIITAGKENMGFSFLRICFRRGWTATGWVSVCDTRNVRNVSKQMQSPAGFRLQLVRSAVHQWSWSLSGRTSSEPGRWPTLAPSAEKSGL